MSKHVDLREDLRALSEGSDNTNSEAFIYLYHRVPLMVKLQIMVSDGSEVELRQIDDLLPTI